MAHRAAIRWLGRFDLDHQTIRKSDFRGAGWNVGA